MFNNYVYSKNKLISIKMESKHKIGEWTAIVSNKGKTL